MKTPISCLGRTQRDILCCWDDQEEELLSMSDVLELMAGTVQAYGDRGPYVVRKAVDSLRMYTQYRQPLIDRVPSRTGETRLSLYLTDDGIKALADLRDAMADGDVEAGG